MTKGKSRIISLFLAFIMIFTMLPMNVFADSFHNGLSTGYPYTPVVGDVPYTGSVNEIKSMNGYKISVWFSEMVGQDENGNPVYGWDNPLLTEQVGKTIYWRRIPLQLKSGEWIKPGFWSAGNAFSQITRGEEWAISYVSASRAARNPDANKSFYYAATETQLERPSGTFTGAKVYFNNLSMGLKAITSCGFTLYDIAYNDADYKDIYGFTGVRDLFARMLDMEHPENVNLKRFHDLFYSNYVLDQGRQMEALDWSITIWNDEEALWKALVDTVGDYYNIPIQGKYNLNANSPELAAQMEKIPNILATPEDFQLPFPSSMKEKSSPGKNDASSQYLRSYFLNPLILNEISWMTGQQVSGTGAGYWGVDDFLRGVYNFGGYERIGQYKIYIEPVMFRSDYRQEGTSKTTAVMSWRDMMSAGQAKIAEHGGNSGNMYLSFIGNLSMAVPQIANAMMLDKEDVSLISNGSHTGEKYFSKPFTQSDTNTEGVWKATGVYKVATDPLNTLGISIVTSPSTASGVIPPEIVKTYVVVDGVNSDGSLNYKKAAPTVKEIATPEKFHIDENGDLTIHPIINHVERVINGEVELGTGLLNDMFTTPYTLVLNENSEWVNTDLITNVTFIKAVTNIMNPNPEPVAVNKVELYPTAEDIAGYRFGLVTGSELFISGIEKFVATVSSSNPDETRKEINEKVNDAFVRTNENIASADEKIYVLPQGNSGSKIYSAIKKVDSVKFENTTDVGIGKLNDTKDFVEKIDFTKEDTSYELLYSVTTPANTLVLRYILIPSPRQVNLVRFYEQAPDGTLTEKRVQVEDPIPLVITGDEVTIQEPSVDIPEGATKPEVVKWVTNSEYPVISLTDSLPPKSDNGKEGTTPNPIPNYPTEPLTHHLYVEWKVIEPAEEIPVGANQDVPEWRISKYLGAITEEYEGSVLASKMNFTKKPDKGCLPEDKSTSLTPMGTYNHKLVNANGRLSNGADTPANMNMRTIGSVASNIDVNYAGVAPNTWFHSKTFIYGGDTDSINHSDNNAEINLDATLNMIKSKDSGYLVAANWLTGNALNLDEYSITNGNKPDTYTGGTEYTKVADLRLGIYNSDTYTHIYGKRYSHHGWPFYCCNCTTGTETISPSSNKVTYQTANYSLDVIFDRYKQRDTSVFNLGISNEEKVSITNGLTTIKYQLDETIKIYPEVGMLFDSDANEESIRWMIGDKVREIKPVVWQTLEHKVWVKPTSTGTSVANDSRGITKANSIGEAGKQIIYKGAGVNTNFRLYQTKDSNKVGLLTMKTYALDFNTSTTELKALKNAWGNSAYNSYEEHKTLLANFQNAENSKATVTEKLLVDANPYTGSNPEFVGATKTVKSNPYKLVKYQNSGNIKVADGSNGDAVVFEHELIIRGGFVIGVRMDNHNGTKTTKTIEQLAASTDNNDISLFNALVGMNLYIEDGGNRVKNGTVLQTLEHKADNAKKLDEGEYASQLAAARRTVDGIATPIYATIQNGDKWYSEDTTVLIVREYVSNFEVPSISISDKLPMTISGTDKLNTPANKNEFFKELGKGYLYLKYNLDILPPAVSGITQNTLIDCYFEYTSLPNDVGDTKGFKANYGSTIVDAPKFGEEKVNYLVPNVSITDTTRMN